MIIELSSIAGCSFATRITVQGLPVKGLPGSGYGLQNSWLPVSATVPGYYTVPGAPQGQNLKPQIGHIESHDPASLALAIR
jgi:hypothetical protein